MGNQQVNEMIKKGAGLCGVQSKDEYPVNGTKQQQLRYRDRVYDEIQNIPRVSYANGQEDLWINWNVPNFKPPLDIMEQVSALITKYPRCFDKIEVNMQKSGIDDELGPKIINMVLNAITS